MSDILMKCGHTAHATTKLPDGTTVPCCAICSMLDGSKDWITPASTEEIPNLEGRQASCPDCGTLRPSSFNLAFFEYRGPGCAKSKNECITCGSHKNFHDPNHWGYKGHEHPFIPGHTREYDSYYCGCRGWS